MLFSNEGENMSEIFIPIPPWLKEGREPSENELQNYVVKCRTCGIRFIGYCLPTQCPICGSSDIDENSPPPYRFDNEKKYGD